jgi:uncharacterized Zn finger protein
MASADSPPPTAPEATPLQSVEVLCPTCGKILRHRVLRTRSPPANSGVARPPRAVQGVGRCSKCGAVHPFRLELPRTARIRVVLSEGRTSESWDLSWDPAREVAVGAHLSLRGRRVKVLRVEDRQGRSLPRGTVDRLRAVWVVPWERVRVPVSVPEGRKTRVLTWETPPGRPITVGEEFSLAGEPLRVVGFHGQGHKEDRPGRSLPAEEIKRVYARPGGHAPEGGAYFASARRPAAGPAGRAVKPPGGRTA